MEISREVDAMKLTTVNRILIKLAFRCLLLRRAYTKQQLERMLAQTAFNRSQVVESGLGLEISITKQGQPVWRPAQPFYVAVKQCGIPVGNLHCS